MTSPTPPRSSPSSPPPPPVVPPSDGDALVAALVRHLAEARADAAAASRAREAWLRQAAAEEARTAGVLLDLAESAASVVVAAPAGRSHRGRVRAVAEDFALLDTDAGRVLVRYRSMLAIRAEGPPRHGADRATSLDLDLAIALAALAGDRPRVRIVGADGSGRSGQLRSVGVDVVTLRLDGDGATVYVPVEAMAEVLVLD